MLDSRAQRGKQPGHARRHSNQPDLRRNSSPDTASITIGGNA